MKKGESPVVSWTNLKAKQIVLASGFFTIFYVYWFSGDQNVFYRWQSDGGPFREHEQYDWQDVGHKNLKFSVHSAYCFNEREIVVIGTPKPFKGQQKISCEYFWQASDGSFLVNETELSKAQLERMHGWTAKFAGSFIRCPLVAKAKTFSRPTHVAVLFGNQTDSPARLGIRYRSFKSPKFQFSVCVLPLYQYNQVFHFIEWLEFYKMMGVEHFTFYNRSIGPATSCIMNYYKKQRDDDIQIAVHPWHQYPQKKDSDIRFGVGLSAGTNACWYGHKGLSKYMIFVDVDEFIVPHRNISNFHHLMEFLKKNFTIEKDDKAVGAYTFRNGFFLKSRERDSQLLDRCAELRINFDEFHACQELWTMQFAERESLQGWHSRTKYIGLPEAVRNGGNHYVLNFEKGWINSRVDANIAFSRHYRNFKESNKTSFERIPNEIGIRLAKTVAERTEYFVKFCKLSKVDVFQST